MKILLVDDYKLFCKSLKVVLEMIHRIEKVDICNKLDKLFLIVKREKYDVILLDINLGSLSEENGLEVAEKLIKKFPDEKIVILTGHNKAIYEYEAMKVGVKGFIDKETEPEILVNHLESIVKGKEIFNIKIVESNKGKKVIVRKEDAVIENLTDREREILKKIRLGEEVEAIARELNISKRTIFNHLANVYQKLGVANKQEAIYEAEKLGYFIL